MLANHAMVVMTLEDINVLNQQVAHLKFTQYYMSIIFHLEKHKKGNTHTVHL